MTGAEWYATIYAFNESPRVTGLLWAGSDDGLVHVSRDGGGSWQNVTPAAYGKFTPHRGDRALALRSGSRLRGGEPVPAGRLPPLLWEDRDYGKSWTRITTGIPPGAYTRTIREDPVRRGLLYAGTEIGVYVSFDDGAHWEPLQLNLPRASVRDLRVHGNDLIAATHGRSFWAIDDIPCCASWATRSPGARPTCSSRRRHRMVLGRRPQSHGGAEPGRGRGHRLLPARRTRRDRRAGVPGCGGCPDPAIYQRYSAARLGAKTGGFDRAGGAGGMKDSVVYEPADSIVSTRAGTNRFVWSLRYPGAKSLPNTTLDEGTHDGPIAPPGAYRVRLIVGADTLTRACRSWPIRGPAPPRRSWSGSSTRSYRPGTRSPGSWSRPSASRISSPRSTSGCAVEGTGLCGAGRFGGAAGAHQVRDGAVGHVR
jgi:hypothetical protein